MQISESDLQVRSQMAEETSSNRNIQLLGILL